MSCVDVCVLIVLCSCMSLLQDFYLATLKEAVLAANPALAGQVQQALEEVAASNPPPASDAPAVA